MTYYSSVKSSLRFKKKGNLAYKSADFARAIQSYQAAIQYNPDEITFYTNLASAQLQTKVESEVLWKHLIWSHFKNNIF